MALSQLRLEGTLRDRTADHLAQLILAGEWAAGEYLPPEGVLIQRLGVSRTAYREALCRLEAQGLVEVRHGVGTRVADRSREAVADSLSLMLQRRRDTTADLLEARHILETEAAALAAGRASAEDLAALDAALDAMRQPRASPEAYITGDLRFHLALALASHNAVLAALAESLRSALHESIAATFEVDGRTERRLQDHQRILAAVRAGDIAGARQAVATHLAATEEMLRRIGRLAQQRA
ncbi:MAG: FadR/GntR family transcriptional regulator [Chloroflexota bacterium]